MRLHSIAWISLIAASVAPVSAGEATVIDLWPEKPPGYQVEGGPERDLTKPEEGKVAGQRLIRLGYVSTPQVHIFPAPKEKANGTAVVICPGGGFSILAWDLEGTEVAEWFNSVGVTAAVLKYRVPTANAEPNWVPPAQDAQRAVRLLRSKAEDFGVDPAKVGLMGFSAGGRTAAMAALKTGEELYPPADAADRTSAKPDFLILVYPAYLVDDGGMLKPEVTVTKDSPPAFLVHAYDDPVTPKSSVVLFLAYKDVGAPAELHVYDAGGHGYGLRPTEQPVTLWPKRCEEWMVSRGLVGEKAK